MGLFSSFEACNDMCCISFQRDSQLLIEFFLCGRNGDPRAFSAVGYLFIISSIIKV